MIIDTLSTEVDDVSRGINRDPIKSALCGDEEMRSTLLGSVWEWGPSALLLLALAGAVSVACAVAKKWPDVPEDEESQPAVE